MKFLAEIQRNLKAIKGQYNNFGKYAYRSCEDIVESVKPLLGDAVLVMSDEIVSVGERVYVKATATITLDGEGVSAVGLAREPQDKKGMDHSQITGAASSYARKYALNGLLAIDDNKDADSMDNTQSTPTPKATPKKSEPMATAQQIDNIMMLKRKADYTEDKFNEVLKAMNVDSIDKLTKPQALRLITGITKKITG